MNIYCNKMIQSPIIIEQINLKTGNCYQLVYHCFYGILSYYEGLGKSGMIIGEFNHGIYQVRWYAGKKIQFTDRILATGQTMEKALKNLECHSEVRCIWNSPSFDLESERQV